jgi:hypothetical protein
MDLLNSSSTLSAARAAVLVRANNRTGARARSAGASKPAASSDRTKDWRPRIVLTLRDPQHGYGSNGPRGVGVDAVGVRWVKVKKLRHCGISQSEWHKLGPSLGAAGAACAGTAPAGASFFAGRARSAKM